MIKTTVIKQGCRIPLQQPVVSKICFRAVPDTGTMLCSFTLLPYSSALPL